MTHRTRLLLAAAALLAVLRSGTPPAAAPPPAAPQRLLVVAPAAFHAALAPFVEHKRETMGRPTDLVTLEAALAAGADGAGAAAADDPERLKRFLFAAWRPGGLGHVLLVGDADVLPVRFMVLDRVTAPAFDYAFYPSDLYYADLARPDGAFEDWNAARDGFHARYFGEVRGEKNKRDPVNFDAVDYRPEIAVGRWPVSTPEEAARVAAKTIAWERAVRQGTAPGLRRAAFFGVAGWAECRPALDAAAAGLPPGWTAEKRYFADKGRDDRTPPPNEAELTRLLAAGVTLVAHAGHGGDDVWEGCFSTATIDRLANADRLPVLISAGCSTARFCTLPPYEAYVDVDGAEHAGTNAGEVFTAPPPPPAPYQKGHCNPTGLGEQLLRRGPHGAVAYIGCNTGSQPCGLTLLTGFGVAIGQLPEPTLGGAWAAAVARYYEAERLADLVATDDWYPPSIFFQGMKFMLFGDPSLTLPGATR